MLGRSAKNGGGGDSGATELWEIVFVGGTLIYVAYSGVKWWADAKGAMNLETAK
jgi:hypothetical protein